MAAARAVQSGPLPVCSRCRGSGTVAVVPPNEYEAEDFTPRELPVTMCPVCGGCGYLPPAEEGA